MKAEGRDGDWEAGLGIVRTLERAGHAAYLVGGCVRDRLLGRELHDIDIATSARPEETAALFARVVPTGLQHGTVTVVEGGRTYEVTTFRQEAGYSDSRHPDAVTFVKDVREDLARRDFTINAMALGADGELVDPFGGRDDLREGVVRCVGDAEERFAEDALRMLRAVRFAAEFGFAIEPATWAGLFERREGLRHVAMERVGVELDKMIGGAGPDRALALLRDSGLLERAREPLPWVLPRLDAAAEAETAGADAAAACAASGPESMSGAAPLAAVEPPLRWPAALLLAGADAEQALRQARALRFSAKRAEAAAAVVGLHRRLAAEGLLPAGRAAGADEAAARRVWTRAALDAGGEAAAGWARLVRQLPRLAGDEGAAPALAERAERWFAAMPALRAQELAIRGDEIVRLAGRAPGPWVAALLRELLERTAAGELANEPEALRTAAEERLRKG